MNLETSLKILDYACHFLRENGPGGMIPQVVRVGSAQMNYHELRINCLREMIPNEQQ